jgi:hypothetical protein
MNLYITVRGEDGEYKAEVEAELLELPEGLPFKFALWRCPGRREPYQVVEASTGRRVVDAVTRKQAVNGARKKLAKEGLARTYAMVAKWPTLNEAFAVNAIEPSPDGPYMEIAA